MSTRTSDPQRDLDNDNRDEPSQCPIPSTYLRLDAEDLSCSLSSSLQHCRNSILSSSTSSIHSFSTPPSSIASRSTPHKRARPRPKLSLYAIHRHMSAPKTIDPIPRSPDEFPTHSVTMARDSPFPQTIAPTVTRGNTDSHIAPAFTPSVVLTSSLSRRPIPSNPPETQPLPSLTPRSHYQFNTSNGPISIPFDHLPVLMTPPLGLAQLEGFFVGSFDTQDHFF
ncbi:hypothetical protein SISNIDRAFT_486839 [Sistotremastrum niveocremeum HHB9708]|uniref:Uncharacterized protein n=1 Tax=Sistotremastrum niveocremeum HHB9708 TaxID=1314777 RepID=A0A164TEX3_9AGAM|nr:hypothetical protein SISNIDRAFT_486839 [Sistotremastrum niveocremeum HHB9708]